MSPVTTPDTDIFDLDFDLIPESSGAEPQSRATRFATSDACGTCTPTVGVAAAPGLCP
jgi:hypothetical protein